MTAADKLMVAGAAVAAMFLIWTIKNGAANTGAAIGGAAVDMANGIVSGAVVGVGQVVGVPPTSQTQCQQDMAAGKTWDASFSCPASEFIKYAFLG